MPAKNHIPFKDFSIEGVFFSGRAVVLKPPQKPREKDVLYYKVFYSVCLSAAP